MFEAIRNRINLVRATVPPFAKEVMRAHRELNPEPTKNWKAALKAFAILLAVRQQLSRSGSLRLSTTRNGHRKARVHPASPHVAVYPGAFRLRCDLSRLIA